MIPCDTVSRPSEAEDSSVSDRIINRSRCAGVELRPECDQLLPGMDSAESDQRFDGDSHGQATIPEWDGSVGVGWLGGPNPGLCAGQADRSRAERDRPE